MSQSSDQKSLRKDQKYKDKEKDKDEDIDSGNDNDNDIDEWPYGDESLNSIIRSRSAALGTKVWTSGILVRQQPWGISPGYLLPENTKYSYTK